MAPARAAVDARVAGRQRADGTEKAAEVVPDTGGRDDAGRLAAPGRVAAVARPTDDVLLLRVGRPAGFDFAAGQYAKLGLPGRRRGSFSLASAPHDPVLEFCIELIPGGRLTPWLFRVGPGDEVELSDRAKGSLRLDGDASTHLMVATGTGIAPVRSMVLDALHRGRSDRIVVVHGSSLAERLPYRDELADLAARHAQLSYVPTVSRPGDRRNAGWSGEAGRADDVAAGLAGGLDPGGTHVYATGNPGMVTSVESTLGGRGFRVSTERFH